MSKIRVLITCNIPSPYMIAYIKELSKSFDIKAVFERKVAKDRDSKWYAQSDSSLDICFLKSLPFGNEAGLSFKITKLLKKRDFDILIIANPTTPTGIVELIYCKKHKIPHIIQSEGGFPGSGKGLKEKFKKYLMKDADLYLTGMGGMNDYFLQYGASKEKLCFFHFSSQSEKEIMNASISSKSIDRAEIKKELKIKESKTIVTVGRFSYKKGYGKGYDILMKIAEKKANEDIGFFIIGDKPTKEFINWKKTKNLNHVHFVEFLPTEMLSKYYLMADMFILLTRNDTWGLVINEAMSYSLPVISSAFCVAANELIQNETNGYIVDLNNIEEIAEKIDCILNNEKLSNAMRQNNLSKIKNYSIDQMAKDVTEWLFQYRH